MTAPISPNEALRILRERVMSLQHTVRHLNEQLQGYHTAAKIDAEDSERDRTIRIARRRFRRGDIVIVSFHRHGLMFSYTICRDSSLFDITLLFDNSCLEELFCEQYCPPDTAGFFFAEIIDIQWLVDCGRVEIILTARR